MSTPAGGTSQAHQPGTAPHQAEPVKYTCAACLSEQTLAFDKPLLCTSCSSRQSTSRIFFKKRRNEPTTYDTN